MRRAGSLNDKLNAPVAGFLSGLSLAIDGDNRRQLISVLTLSRALDVSFRIGEDYGVMPNRTVRDWVLWLFANCFLQTAMGLKQGILNKSLQKFFSNQAQMKTNDKIQVEIWHRMLQDGVPGF